MGRATQIKRLSELLSEAGISPSTLKADPLVRGITHDSRHVRAGDLFVAIPGQRFDGHRFIPEALARGAVAIVGERRDLEVPNVPYITVEGARRALARLACAFYDHPTRSLFTVGITGTKGKTSVAHLSAAVLGGPQTELLSTITNALERGVDQTTPEAPEIQRLAYEALQAGKEHLVLEVSAHGLSLERVWGVDFDVGVFTNLSHDHLDYYSDFERYLEAKRKLFARLKPTATAIINRADPAAPSVISITKARVLTYGLSAEADLWAEGIELSPQGAEALIHTPEGSFRLKLALIGEFAVENALAAIGVGIARGLPLPQIKARLEGVKRIEGRMERYPTTEGFTVVIDFAHSPDSLRRAIEALRPFYSRVIVVFGCGGDSDKLKRPLMGRISARLGDYTIITSDNPKGEDPLKIIREIERGLKGLQAPYEAIPDRRRAIEKALQLARPGDCVLIAGKGHERTQIFKDRQIPFNDAAYLEALGLISTRR